MDSSPAAGDANTEQITARLRDGQTVTVREAGAADEPAISEFLSALCLEARHLRFFGGVDVPSVAHRIAATGPDRLGVVALDGTGAVVGHALAIQLGRPRRAEVAIEVADQLHSQGLGTILIERLAQLAERRGIATFAAQVLPENRAMLDVFHDGFDAHVRLDEGIEKVEFPTSSWRLARRRFSAMFGASG